MKVVRLFAVVFTLFLACSLMAQQPGPPPGAVPAGGGDKNLQIDDSKMRSIELERVKRDAEKPDRKNQPAPAPPAAFNFEQIKQDFESIQRLQDDLVTVYSKSKGIDYTRISSDAAQMNQSATRLESNLFPPVEKKKDSKKIARETEPNAAELPLPQDIKSLIVEQDNTLAIFVTNPMFTNPQVINPDNNAKAHFDLQRLIKLSAALQQEADKLKK